MDVDENHLESVILNNLPSDPTSENTCSNINQLRERLVDYSSNNSLLYSISPVVVNSQDAKQKDNFSPYSLLYY